MENASKALIIAGSILLSILIIALGMYIFSQSSATSDVSVLTETETQTFNAKFDKYKGAKLGSEVDSLISALRSNAVNNQGATEKIPTVYVDGTAKASRPEKKNDITTYTKALDEISGDLASSHKYTVKLQYDNSNGLISDIAIGYTSSQATFGTVKEKESETKTETETKTK